MKFYYVEDSATGRAIYAECRPWDELFSVVAEAFGIPDGEYISDRCEIYESFDGGETYADPDEIPEEWTYA